ncbi:MAG: RNA repair transcriptional activator RtcR [Lentisphaeria bacterium]|nr:RNA repair transcriptional activator RtcR [Lentisphaeria bacterium]
MNIVISLLGTTLDQRGAKQGLNRWNTWRPSVALAMQEDLLFDRYYLIYPPEFERLKDKVVEDIKVCSPSTKVIAEPVKMGDPWDFEEVYSKLYDFSCNHDFSGENNQYYIHITTGTHVAQICLFLLNESHHLPGKLIQTHPGVGPEGSYSIIDLDLSRYDLLAKRFAVERENDLDFLKSGIATRNRQFNNLIETIERVAIRSAEPILLTGPTGAGKSQLAKRIYELKKLNNQLKGDFINVNCATLRGDQAMSVLFGHKKGSFTGAVSDRAGLLKKADGGILFLDEIGELGLDEQAMLLRAIEEKKFFPLGADTESESSFELICGTNRDLEEAVQTGHFRSDLLARINLWDFQLPGLANRREDIEPNVEYELNRFSEKSGKHITFNKEARAIFMRFALDPATTWRGNFRDLNAMITRMATLSSGGRIDENIVKDEIARLRGSQRPSAPDKMLEKLLGRDYQSRFDEFDLCQLIRVVEVCRTSKNRAEAGKKLFAVSRQTKTTANDSDRLGKYLEKFKLTFQMCKEV